MPKRTREDETKEAPPLSALAARRLRSQETILPAPKTPETKRKSDGGVAASGDSSLGLSATAASSESEGAEDLQAKRREIERTLKDQTKAQAQTQQVLGFGSPGLEAALITVGQRCGDGARLDDEMVDVSELVELESERGVLEGRGKKLQGRVNLSYSGESPTPKLTQCSSFVPTEKNHSPNTDNRQTIFRIVNRETLVILGEYDFQVIKGTITIAGATLTKSSGVQRVYAPSTQSLPVIECVGKKEGKNKDGKKDGEFDAEILVSSPVSNSGLRDVGKLCPMFGGIWTPPGIGKQNGDVESFFPLYSTTYSVPTLSVPQPWRSCFERFAKQTDFIPSSFSSTVPPVIVITGSKGTGKSTFARTLVNTLLTFSPSHTSVAYLDCDPGQPEFSPPGFISLHHLTAPVLGPPFTHSNPAAALRTHYTGFTSPREDPAHYIASIINLITLYRDTLASATTAQDARIPLVINTAGWTKGLGLELLADIIAQSQASDIVFLSGPMERFNPIAEICPESARMHELESISASAGPARFSAADLRALQIMSYLHHCPEKGKWDFETPLTSVAPWVVPYTGPASGVNGIQVLGEQLVPEELVTAIDGTLVGVVLIDGDDLGDIFHTAETLPYLQNAPPPPSPETSFSAGLALIRGVDVKEGCLWLLTSIAESEIERWEREGWKVVLVRGRLELPVWEMIGAGVEGAPWVSVGAVVGAGGKGGDVWRVRRNVMRRGQQTGKDA